MRWPSRQSKVALSRLANPPIDHDWSWFLNDFYVYIRQLSWLIMIVHLKKHEFPCFQCFVPQKKHDNHYYVWFQSSVLNMFGACFIIVPATNLHKDGGFLSKSPPKACDASPKSFWKRPRNGPGWDRSQKWIRSGSPHSFRNGMVWEMLRSIFIGMSH